MNASATRNGKAPRLGLRLASRFLTLYLRLVYATSRWRVENAPVFGTLLREGGPAVMVFWHGRMCAMPHIFRAFGKGHVLISAHRDGELIARVMEAMGYWTVRGSTARLRNGEARAVDKGGAAALRTLIRILKQGGRIAITPDGPRGPRMRISPGAILLGALSGAPLVPVTCAPSFAVRFKSWDGFLLPLPFGRIEVGIGEPLRVPRDADEAQQALLRRTLEERLNGLTQDCDKRAGRTPIAPAAPNGLEVLEPSP